MQLVSLTFHSDRHQHHVSDIKFCEGQSEETCLLVDLLSECFGSDTQEDFFIFDLETSKFEAYLTFLLSKMCLGFGGDRFI